MRKTNTNSQRSNKKGNPMRTRKLVKSCFFVFLIIFLLSSGRVATGAATSGKGGSSLIADLDDWANSKLWSKHPAAKWTEALPVGNGRLGAMVFGKTDVERIQFNEETYWSGGPYSQTVKGGYKLLPEIQKLLFEGD